MRDPSRSERPTSGLDRPVGLGGHARPFHGATTTPRFMGQSHAHPFIAPISLPHLNFPRCMKCQKTTAHDTYRLEEGDVLGLGVVLGRTLELLPRVVLVLGGEVERALGGLALLSSS